MIVLVRITAGKEFIEGRITESNLLKLFLKKDKNKLPFEIEILNEFQPEDDSSEIDYFIKKRIKQMDPEEIKKNITDLRKKEDFLLKSIEDVHQIKMENTNATVDAGTRGFIIMEIPKMQLIENLRMQLINIRKEIKIEQEKISV